ncbi:hypothetical protein SBC1_02960 [Caballeronia sp. SBC1]|uniref:tyrosine-type recombinase/integrase n=1 Tax=Caballeronia sp. SBC1 TaxID=2705548 RepID=UPI00140955D3|nr:tyrosine-type recombinase/integrase [Caballeronia sp. SBC1]QIN60321.1 hypothetical protein SBC1_02960 [Caballeronia sp. SBC1]
MARVIYIKYQQQCVAGVTETDIDWQDLKEAAVDDFPQICWADGAVWAEANLWALHMAALQRKLRTIVSAMTNLLTFANWLESTNLSWWHFPDLEKERCIFRYRKALTDMRDDGQFAPSTATQRMNTALRFYLWIYKVGLISESAPMSEVPVVGVQVADRFGFDDSMKPDVVAELAIKNRGVVGGVKLEDGVLPVSAADMAVILKWAKKHASEELYLILWIGFWTGLRIGSILDLKKQTIENAIFDREMGIYQLSVGPRALPRVDTKNDADGQVLIPHDLLRALRAYMWSGRRLLREGKASEQVRNHLFITRCGNAYNQEASKAIWVEMHRLRKLADAQNFVPFFGFHIHRTRATFATELMRLALKHMEVADAVQFVRNALLHVDEKTTFDYINFIHTQGELVHVFDEFNQQFMGCWGGAKDAER